MTAHGRCLRKVDKRTIHITIALMIPIKFCSPFLCRHHPQFSTESGKNPRGVDATTL